jgi:hypothetical protein
MLSRVFTAEKARECSRANALIAGSVSTQHEHGAAAGESIVSRAGFFSANGSILLTGLLATEEA